MELSLHGIWGLAIALWYLALCFCIGYQSIWFY